MPNVNNIFNKISPNNKSAGKKSPPPVKDLKKTAETALTFFKNGCFFLDIYLVENWKIRRLNKKFRGKDKVANVLSFKEPDDFPHPEITGRKNKKSAGKIKYLGEIYLAPAHIKERGENIQHLLVHGILHLFGYTHNNKNDTIKMARWENKILKCLNSSPSKN